MFVVMEWLNNPLGVKFYMRRAHESVFMSVKAAQMWIEYFGNERYVYRIEKASTLNETEVQRLIDEAESLFDNL